MADSHSLEEFSKRIVVTAKLVAGNISKTIRKAALAADQVAVLATPVDTGRARANWFASVNAPSDEQVGAIGESALKGGDSGANGARAAQESLDRAQKAIATFQEGDGSIFLTNNVVYAPFLDKGSSRQAPQGMTKAAIQAAAAIIRKGTS